MKHRNVIVASVLCFTLGATVGLWAKGSADALSLFKGKPAKEAGQAALAQAEKLAEKGSWELIAIGRVYYLSGDKTKGQSYFDRVIGGKVQGSDWQRIGDVYNEAGEKDKAEACYKKVLAADPKDDTGQSEIGSWYIRNGQRERGEELYAKALDRNPEDVWHYIRAGEAYMGVPRGR
jgi:tetratricopeptide (TPR) repeat protein